MDRFSKLNALQGGVDLNAIINSPWDEPDLISQLKESDVPETPLAPTSSKIAKPQNLYEETDSEDDEAITSRGKSYHSVTTTTYEPQVVDTSKSS